MLIPSFPNCLHCIKIEVTFLLATGRKKLSLEYLELIQPANHLPEKIWGGYPLEGLLPFLEPGEMLEGESSEEKAK